MQLRFFKVETLLNNAFKMIFDVFQYGFCFYFGKQTLRIPEYKMTT